jgi:hypothetical protein
MNTTKQILEALNTQSAAVTPDMGFGFAGEWPDAGPNECQVTGLTMSDMDFYDGSEKRPGIGIQFHYRLLSDPKRPEPLSWKGRPIVLTAPGNVQNEKSRKKLDIELGRLAGFIKNLLSRDPSGNLPADVDAMRAKIEGDGVVAATINVNVDKVGDREYKQEYCQAPIDTGG